MSRTMLEAMGKAEAFAGPERDGDHAHIGDTLRGQAQHLFDTLASAYPANTPQAAE
jgi:hypothetical protein